MYVFYFMGGGDCPGLVRCVRNTHEPWLLELIRMWSLLDPTESYLTICALISARSVTLIHRLIDTQYAQAARRTLTLQRGW